MMVAMRTVSDQLTEVLAAVRPAAPLDVVLADAEGTILAQDVVAPGDVPAIDVAGCDGYAVRLADAPGVLPVVDDARVTAPVPVHLVPGTAVLVAAGAPLPVGAEAVVPLAATDRGRARVEIREGATAGGHVRVAGSDAAAGAVVLGQGTRLAARHLALAALVGCGRLRVHPRPRVVVAAVGDELVEPGRPRAAGRVHDADSHALVAAARAAGATAVRVGPLPDDRAELREALADQLVRADVLIITGGLSAGPWDTVTDVLAPLGTVRFDQVAMTPGRRQGFGTLASGVSGAPEAGDLGLVDDGADPVPVFALPGHPVAALVGFEVFVRPALRAMAGHAELFRPSVRAGVTRPFASPAGLRQFVPAVVSGGPVEGYTVEPVGDPGEVSLAALAGANALAVVAEDVTRVHAGDVLGCLVLDS